MTDVYGPEKRSAVMRRVKGAGTTPELVVRQLVWRLGGRYRLNRKDLPGKPDIVLAGRRLAIFVHGCFWHGHDCARGARVPKTNRDYWLAKVGRLEEHKRLTRWVFPVWLYVSVTGVVVWAFMEFSGSLAAAAQQAVK